jgi:HSP20 family protein
MNIEKMKKWLELTNQYKHNSFWNSVFDNANPAQFFGEDQNYPKYEIYESDTHICIIFELPGVLREDLSVSLESGTKLIIKGIIKPPYPKEMEVMSERFFGEFERTIILSHPTEPQSIQTYSQSGLYQLSYPKK